MGIPLKLYSVVLFLNASENYKTNLDTHKINVSSVSNSRYNTQALPWVVLQMQKVLQKHFMLSLLAVLSSLRTRESVNSSRNDYGTPGAPPLLKGYQNAEIPSQQISLPYCARYEVFVCEYQETR